MAGEHDRFEELAVGHVLGGLPSGDAAEFRSHLTGCRDCRARVAELRGIASDLAAAEREERHRARVKTEVQRRTEEDEAEPPPSWQLPSRAIGLTLATVVLVLMGLSFWNFHLRDQAAVMAATTRTGEAILEGLAEGTMVDPTFTSGASGVVAVAEQDVVLTLTGLPVPTDGQRLVVWLLGDTPDDHRWRGYGPTEVSSGRLAWRTAHHGAHRLEVTLEAEPVPSTPAGRRIVGADLAVE